MENRNNQRKSHREGVKAPRAGGTGPRVWRACAFLVFVAAFACMAQNGGPPQGSPLRMDKADAQTQLNTPPDANAQMLSRENQAKGTTVETANAERKKQIADDSTKLLTMAIALKAEVDKTTKDTLSLNVIRKADEIEKLAHSVKEKMKQAAGPG